MSDFKCNKCGTEFKVQLPSVVNVGTSPELKEKILSGELFLHQCPECGEMNLVKGNMVYVDPSEKLILCLTDGNLSSEGGVPDHTCRIVGSVGELIEKIKIFDASLDDIAIEMCKAVTLQELGKDVNLKFFQLDGPDNEIILTYPQDSKMEMLSIGLNVYEDCLGILSRNPELSAAASGLVKVDRAWLERFIKA